MCRLKTVVFLALWMLCGSACEVACEECIWRHVENNAFAEGEYLRFVVRWGMIHGGYATMEVNNIVELNKRPAYSVVSQARTNSFFDTFFKVRDINQTWIDVESICSQQYDRNIREGRYRSHRRVVYDHPKRFVTMYSSLSSTTTGEITPFIQDVLSALYFIRTQTLEPGKELSVEVNTSGENWPLIVKVKGRGKAVTPAGTYSCLLIEPEMAEEGIFDAKGRILIWVTDDQRHMPVKMNSKIKIGSITAELISIDRNESEKK